MTAANCALNDAHCTSSTVSVVCLQLSRCHARKNTTCLGDWILSIISGDSERKCTHVVGLVWSLSLTLLTASPRKRTFPRLLVMAKLTLKIFLFVLFAQSGFYCQKQRKTNGLSVVGCKRTPTILSGVALPGKQTKALYHIT